MTTRDRIVLIVLAAAALLAGFWFMVLTPKREDARKLDAQIATEHSRLAAAQASAAQAVDAKARYRADYATIARLGKAVPLDDQVPSLIAELQSAATGSRVDFLALKVNAQGSAAAPAVTSGIGAVAAVGAASKGTTPPAASAAPTQAAAAALPPGATVGSAGFPTMPFTFTFEGSFASMRRFLGNVQRLVRVHGGVVNVDGRLMTIDAFSLSAGADGLPQVKATLNATTYLLPADEGLMAGAASPASPGGAEPVSGTTASGGAAPATTTATITGVK